MSVEFTLETLTKEKVIEMIQFWGNTYASEYCGSQQEMTETEQEITAVIRWVEQHSG